MISNVLLKICFTSCYLKSFKSQEIPKIGFGDKEATTTQKLKRLFMKDVMKEVVDLYIY